MKYVWDQVYTCRAANQDCMGGGPLVDYCNKGHTRTPTLGESPREPTDQRIMTNVNQIITEATKAYPILCQATNEGFISPRRPGVLTLTPHWRGGMALCTG